MKKLKLITLLTIIMLSLYPAAKAMSQVAVSESSMVNLHTAQQIKKPNGPDGAMFIQRLEMLSTRYSENFQNCEPLHIDQYYDVFGLKITFKADINGWVNNKCEIKVTGNVISVGKDIREVFEVKAPDEKIAAIKPVVECNFTKEQLKIATEAIAASNAQNEAILIKMMRSPERAVSKKKQLAPAEKRFMTMLMSENVCAISNKDEVMKLLDEIINPK